MQVSRGLLLSIQNIAKDVYSWESQDHHGDFQKVLNLTFTEADFTRQEAKVLFYSHTYFLMSDNEQFGIFDEDLETIYSKLVGG